MGLRENILKEPISVLSLRSCATVTGDTSVRQTVAAMRQQHVGAAIVVDDAGRAVGMFTEKLLIALLLDQAGRLDEPVADHMNAQMNCLLANDSIAALISAMQHHDLRWVCIIDDAGKPIALTGLRGVLEYVADYFPRQVKVQPIHTSNVSIRTREGA